MEDVGQNDPLQLSDSTRAALDQLLSQIDQATSTVETHLTADSYAALAALPLSYPWSCLVLDLKELLPILDRYVLSCIIASHATLYTDLTHDQTLFPLLRALAQTIVNIISPQASLNTRPVLPKEIYKVEFWHAHLNYACLRASDAGLPGGGAARLAGVMRLIPCVSRGSVLAVETNGAATGGLSDDAGSCAIAEFAGQNAFGRYPGCSICDIAASFTWWRRHW